MLAAARLPASCMHGSRWHKPCAACGRTGDERSFDPLLAAVAHGTGAVPLGSLVSGKGFAQVDACCDAEAGDGSGGFGICGVSAGDAGLDDRADVSFLVMECPAVRAGSDPGLQDGQAGAGVGRGEGGEPRQGVVL
jgi:hypothetical protein